MALRTAAISEVAPVDVSLWTTQTALISRPVSARRRSSILLASDPAPPSDSMNSGLTPSFRAMFFHNVAKWPVSYMSTRSPGDIRLESEASHAPVPDDG